MGLRSELFRILRYGLLLTGSSMLLVVSASYADRLVSLRAERAQFIAQQEQLQPHGFTEAVSPKTMASRNVASATSTGPARGAAGMERLPKALALLRIPRLQLDVPVLPGTDEVTLNRGVGWIAGTSLPGEEGNIGIAGHRDSFFRPLEEIQVGDAIELLTPAGKTVYAVDQGRVVSPADVEVLRRREKSSITLVTCYPFYFVGPAPNRFIVEASLKQ